MVFGACQDLCRRADRCDTGDECIHIWRSVRPSSALRAANGRPSALHKGFVAFSSLNAASQAERCLYVRNLAHTTHSVHKWDDKFTACTSYQTRPNVIWAACDAALDNDGDLKANRGKDPIGNPLYSNIERYRMGESWGFACQYYVTILWYYTTFYNLQKYS